MTLHSFACRAPLTYTPAQLMVELCHLHGQAQLSSLRQLQSQVPKRQGVIGDKTRAAKRCAERNDHDFHDGLG